MRRQFQSIHKVLGRLATADQLHDGVEHVRSVQFLLFLQHEHKVIAKTRLHHDPVNGARQVDVRRQKYYVFALQRCDRFVHFHQMRHDRLQTALPFARRARTRTAVWSKFARFLVFNFFRVSEIARTSSRRELARKTDCVGDFLQDQIANRWHGPAARWTAR